MAMANNLITGLAKMINLEVDAHHVTIMGG